VVNEDPMFLMSIRPKFAYQIFTGKKKFELRRWIGVPIPSGSTIIVYVSGNVRAIMGEFTVGKVIFGSPIYIWREVMKYPSPGIDEDDKPYISGAKKALAIEVLNPRLYARSISLEELRSIIPGFNPPLSYRRLYENEPLVRLILSYIREYSS